jgi:hypothetical protein
LVNTTQQVGGAFGLAIFATLASARTNRLLSHGADTASALTEGYHLAFGVAAGFAVTALVIAVSVLRPSALRTAKQPQTTRQSPAHIEEATCGS